MQPLAIVMVAADDQAQDMPQQQVESPQQLEHQTEVEVSQAEEVLPHIVLSVYLISSIAFPLFPSFALSLCRSNK